VLFSWSPPRGRRGEGRWRVRREAMKGLVKPYLSATTPNPSFPKEGTTCPPFPMHISLHIPHSSNLSSPYGGDKRGASTFLLPPSSKYFPKGKEVLPKQGGFRWVC